MKRILLILLTASVMAQGADYTPSASRFGAYSANVIQGVVGGIPNREGGSVINAATYGFSEAASAATNTAAIHSALDAATVGDVVQLPAGTFATNTIFLNYTRSGKTLRGAGKDVTILHAQQTEGIDVGYTTDFGSVFNPSSTITAMTKGSAVITVSNGAGFPSPSTTAQHRIGVIKLANEPTTPVVSTYGYENVRTITVTMISRSGNNITLSQPLPSAFENAPSATFELAHQLEVSAYGIGVEDLTIDGEPAHPAMKNGILLHNAHGCWVKNVHVNYAFNYGINLTFATNIEVRKCKVVGRDLVTSSIAGILMNTCSYCLVEDNELSLTFPGMEINQGSTANVVAYNYLGTHVQYGQLNANHGAHNSYNLYEGNVCTFIYWDGLFGGASEDTVYRNRMDKLAVAKRFTRNMNLIGNISVNAIDDGSGSWGEPRMSNSGNNGGTASLINDDPWSDWDPVTDAPRVWTGTLTTRGSDTSGTITLETGTGADFEARLALNNGNVRLARFVGTTPASNGELAVTDVTGDVLTVTYGGILAEVGDTIEVFGGYNGFDEIDLDVVGTMLLKANYRTHTASIPEDESLGADTLQQSYFRSAKPDYFGTLPWPPFDPFNPGASTEESIPAGYRYVNGDAEIPEAVTKKRVKFGGSVPRFGGRMFRFGDN